MARRQSRCLVALLTSLALAACAADGSSGSSSVTPPIASAPMTTTMQTTTTTLTTTTVTTGVTAPSGTGSLEVDAEIVVPDGEGPFPAVVLVHGGGWVGGGPSIMRPLADFLNDNGFLTVNTPYTLSTIDRPGFPRAVDDVACAVRLAANLPQSNGTVALIGHSAGAHIGAVVALTGDDYAADCSSPGTGIPDRFVGLAGPYDVSRLALAAVFFGSTPASAPDVWARGNPQVLTDRNTDLDSLIMYGELDGLVDESFSIDFADALETSGSTAFLEKVEGAYHNDMHDPDLVGDLVATWLER